MATSREAVVMKPLLPWIAPLILLATPVLAQLPNETVAPIASPSIPAGPLPTATVTPLQTTPEPTVTVTPLPSASPVGPQPQTTNTATPSATASPSATKEPVTTNTVAPTPTPST